MSCQFIMFDALQDDGKFIASQAGQRILSTQAYQDTLSDLPEQFVSDRVTCSVVDVLETIQIDEQQADFTVFPVSAGQGMF
ncbi:MAG: hypothetical protein JMN25_17105 [gamma proteobacterium endosymbiont of Lamellibrachia anaximandri]|nr:hypothetical protein [gamma proteobacterium endosymbiont of Lamellibrachia anaximandri]